MSHGKDEAANHERWLISYADFITLLFAFFVVMYAISEIDRAQMAAVADSVLFAFGEPGAHRSKRPLPYTLGGDSVLSGRAEMTRRNGTMLPSRARRDLSSIRKRIRSGFQSRLAQGGLQGAVTTAIRDDGLLIRLPQVHFFDAGGAALRPEAMPVLDVIGHQLRGHRHDIRIEGHTDGRTFTRAPGKTNWELAAARAVSVARYLHAAGELRPTRLSVATFGEHRPLESNDTAAGRARNRRIDIIVAPLRRADRPRPAKPKPSDADVSP